MCVSSLFMQDSADFESFPASPTVMLNDSKQAKTCTIRSHQKGIPFPVATVCTANILSSAMTDRETDPLTIDEPIRWKMPEGKKEKKIGRVTPDQREALLWLTGTPSV